MQSTKAKVVGIGDGMEAYALAPVSKTSLKVCAVLTGNVILFNGTPDQGRAGPSFLCTDVVCDVFKKFFFPSGSKPT